MNYLYLHGFASGPQSRKAQYLRDRFRALDLTLHIPDLNQDDFLNLTFSRQIQQVSQILETTSGSWSIIGSSFGGLTAAWVAQQQPTVQRLVLLAPAFGFLDHWLPILGEAQRQRWQAKDFLNVYHYTAQQELPLRYQFVEDLSRYREGRLRRSVSTLILHGMDDQTVPLRASQQYAAQRTWVELRAFNSDHALANVLPQIWSALQSFLALQ